MHCAAPHRSVHRHPLWPWTAWGTSETPVSFAQSGSALVWRVRGWHTDGEVWRLAVLEETLYWGWACSLCLHHFGGHRWQYVNSHKYLIQPSVLSQILSRFMNYILFIYRHHIFVIYKINLKFFNQVKTISYSVMLLRGPKSKHIFSLTCSLILIYRVLLLYADVLRYRLLTLLPTFHCNEG